MLKNEEKHMKLGFIKLKRTENRAFSLVFDKKPTKPDLKRLTTTIKSTLVKKKP